MAQPGPEVPAIQATLPPQTPIIGQHVQLRALHPDDAEPLFQHLGGPLHAPLWTFMPDGPYPSLPTFALSIAQKSHSTDPLFYAVIDPTTSSPVGHVSFLNINLPHRTIELGHLIYSPSVQRSVLTTEIIYLMMKLVFESGFRRCEWKCNDLNGPSKAAARRFGFVPEGVFRQHLIVKGRNRDTAWFSVVDGEWGAVREAFEAWLDPGNFEGGRQRRRLEEFRRV